MALIKCPECGKEVSSLSQSCVNCGYPIKGIVAAPRKKDFTGIYKYSIFSGKQEVYCPRCGSSNCSYYQQEKFVPGKTKTRYTMNLNSLYILLIKKKKLLKKINMSQKKK